MDLTGTILTAANLSHSNLTGVDLSGKDLTGAILTDANLANANLTEANLTDTVLTGAILTDANLENVIIINSIRECVGLAWEGPPSLELYSLALSCLDQNFQRR